MEATLPQWIESIGWVLINSLWQALAIVLILVTVLRLMPARWSTVRYAAACSSLLLFVIASAVTFVVVNNSSITAEPTANELFSLKVLADQPAQASQTQAGIAGLIHAIANHMTWLLMAWLTGACMFSIRFFSGWVYLQNLKTNSLAVDQSWNDMLAKLANVMAIRGDVGLAESSRISTPMVVGYLKPVILLPFGMVGGLSTEQIETILVHELAHIKRHDFIINLLQAFIETLFFFNPFVWVLSNIIRREREYCCDDEVVRHGNSTAYAFALAQLEAWRQSNPALALSLATNRNQLLNRIKRIMEKSGANYSAKDRLIPAVLLVVGLVCASWLTIKTENRTPRDKKIASATNGVQDTTIRSKSKGRTTIITFDENGKAHEQIFEEFEGDLPTDFFDAPFPAIADMTDFPDIVPAIPPTPMIAEIPGIPAIPAIPSFHFDFSDTIPHGFYRSNENWEGFSKAFEKKFKEQFGDFYKKNQKDFDKMMNEMKDKFSADFSYHWGDLEESKIAADRYQALAQMEAFKMNEQEQMRDIELAHLAEAKALADIEALAGPRAEVEEALAARAADLDALGFNTRKMEEELKEMELRSARYQEELKDMLVKDGYISKDEKINTIEYNNEEVIINGKKIKEKDRDKYRDLKRKYFENSFHYLKTE